MTSIPAHKSSFFYPAQKKWFSVIWMDKTAICIYVLCWLARARSHSPANSLRNTTTAYPWLTQALLPCDTIPTVAATQRKLQMPLDIQCHHINHQWKSRGRRLLASGTQSRQCYTQQLHNPRGNAIVITGHPICMKSLINRTFGCLRVLMGNLSDLHEVGQVKHSWKKFKIRRKSWQVLETILNSYGAYVLQQLCFQSDFSLL